MLLRDNITSYNEILLGDVMNLTAKTATDMALKFELTGADLRVWLLLVDQAVTSADLARLLNIAPTNTAASCRKLLKAGLIELVEEVGRARRYTARSGD